MLEYYYLDLLFYSMEKGVNGQKLNGYDVIIWNQFLNIFFNA